MRASVVPFVLLAACGSSASYDPGVTPDEFQKGVTNPFCPLQIGARFTFTATTPDGLERIEVEVLSEAKKVAWGVDVTVVRDTEYLDDELIEDTKDWYAQHSDGSVWYMGEATAEYENGQVTSTEGSWEAGVDGALPGIVMPGNPVVGLKYRQEFYEGEAEDYGEIVALDAAVSVPAGAFAGCVKTHDTSAIDSALDELKYYCEGVGLALVEEGSVRVELIRFSGL